MSVEETRRHVSVGWVTPLRAAHGGDEPHRPRELTLVSLSRGGVVGFGESAFLAGYSGVSREQADAAAIDVAAWDLRGRTEGVPVWHLLGATHSPSVEVNATIGAEAPDRAAEEAARAAHDGFRTVKVKAGVGDDFARVAAVRSAVGAEVEIRLDANGAWGVEEAVSALRQLARWRLELCEEPVHGAEALATVAARVPEVLIVADESAGEVLSAVVRAGAGREPGCAGVCLKAARGGITQLLADAERARNLGLFVYLASTLDGPLGIAAALHAAAVIAPDRASGLVTLGRFDRPAPISPVAGMMSPPPGPGLGDGLLDFYGED